MQQERNDILMALKARIDRLKTKRRLSHIPPHEMCPLDIEIDRETQKLKRATFWANVKKP